MGLAARRVLNTFEGLTEYLDKQWPTQEARGVPNSQNKYWSFISFDIINYRTEIISATQKPKQWRWAISRRKIMRITFVAPAPKSKRLGSKVTESFSSRWLAMVEIGET